MNMYSRPSLKELIKRKQIFVLVVYDGGLGVRNFKIQRMGDY